MRDIVNEEEEDGFSIVKKAFDYDILKIIPDSYEDNYCKNLINAHKGNYNVWEVIEFISFGNFIRLYP